MALLGLRPSAPRVLSGTGWRLPDGLSACGTGSYIVPLRWRGRRPDGRLFICRFAALRLSPPTGGIYTGAERRRTSPVERCYITTLGGALKLSGRRSRFRTEPLGPRAAGPAAPSTLTPVRACQPSGIQLSAVLPHQLIISRSDFLPQSADTPAHRHHRDPFPSGFPYWYGNRSCLRPPAQRGSPWCRTSWHRCRRRREPL